MWCRQCQQDVPVMRAKASAPACPRCRRPLVAATDVGVALDSFDQPPAATGVRLAPWTFDESAARLRRLERKLRPPVRAVALGPPPSNSDEAPIQAAADARSLSRRQPPSTPRTDGAMLVLSTGVLTMMAGAMAVAAQAVGAAGPELWRWGMAGAIVGEGLFTAGLLWLAAAAAHHSHVMQRELDALRGQLTEIQVRNSPPSPLRTAFGGVRSTASFRMVR